MTVAAHDIGARLRRAREERGLTLRDLANRTRLSMITLRAIERNDFGALPGGLYPKAYIRMLATELGVNAGELAREYVDQFEPEIVATPPPRPGWLAVFRDRGLAAHPALAWLGGRRKGTVPP
ncbi:MAG: helix-turn-helix transcriptional regulator [Acidobacteriota bacterium]|nr:helix-turn-helix transcriptional regulator [Acidobacteriota bacterium]